MLSFVHDTIDTCRGGDDEGNHNFPSHRMASKTTPKTTISQILICGMNMLSSITFSRPTGHQPKQQLQLHFHKMQCSFLYGPRVIPHKMQCPHHFFMRSTCHPPQNVMSTLFLWGPSVTQASNEFHVKVALLALPTHHLLTWS
jgi:hypothetical protein